MKNGAKRFEYSISITGKDQPGIIAAVTKSLFDLGGNLEDASMTILRGQFSMILLASFKAAMPMDFLIKTIRALELEKKLSIHIDRIITDQRRSKAQSSKKKIRSHLVSIFGRDKSGIVYRVSSALAKFNLNITDLDSKLIGSGKRQVYALLLEVDIPISFNIKILEAKLKQIARMLKVDVQIKPIESSTF